MPRSVQMLDALNYNSFLLLLCHDVDVTATLSWLLLVASLAWLDAEQIVDAAGVAHARSRPAWWAVAGVGDRPEHGRRCQAVGRSSSCQIRRTSPNLRRHERRWCAVAGHQRRWGSRGRWRSSRHRSRSTAWRRWCGRLRRRVLSTRLLVNPSLEFRVVHETAGLTKLGTDGLSRR